MNRYSALFGFQEISRTWAWSLLLGVLITILGVVALGGMWATTLASVRIFGLLLVVAGLLETIVAIGTRHARGLLVRALTGVLSVAIGSVLMRYPSSSVAALTMLLVLLFLTSGLLRTLTAVILRYPAWEWTALECIGAAILGVLLWVSEPVSSLWVIGMFVGLGLIFRGVAWVMFALAARHVRRVVLA